MKRIMFVGLMCLSHMVHADVLLDLVNNACHVPTSKTNPTQEFHMKGCNPITHIDENGDAWAYTWVEKSNVPRRVPPGYPDGHNGVLDINAKTEELGAPCIIRSQDYEGNPMAWVSNDWHSGVKITRTESESWVSVRYFLYCYAGRPQ